MRFLLDTAVFIYLGSNQRDLISKKALRVYENPQAVAIVSQVSLWEMAIKVNIGKLRIPIGLKGVITSAVEAGIEILPLQNQHIIYYASLPLHPSHRDPFDRMIVSISVCEDLPVMTNDDRFDLYESRRIW